MDVEIAEAPPVHALTHRGRILGFTVLLALANLMWASQGVAVKYLQPFLGPIAVTFLPFYIATILLLPLLIWKRRKNPSGVRPGWNDWKTFLWAGVIGQAVSQLTSTWGAMKSTASNFAILNLLIPVMTAVLAPLMLRERVTRLQALCLAIGLVGVLLMSMDDLKHASFINASYFTGNILLLAGCGGSAFYNVYCKGLMQKFSELEILIYSYITASLSSVGVLMWREPDCLHRLALLNTQAWIAFIFLALFMYGVSMLLFFYVLKFLPVTVASASLYLLPIFGVILAMIFVGERLNAYEAAGAAVVLVSTVLIMKYDAAD